MTDLTDPWATAVHGKTNLRPERHSSPNPVPCTHMGWSYCEHSDNFCLLPNFRVTTFPQD